MSGALPRGVMLPSRSVARAVVVLLLLAPAGLVGVPAGRAQSASEAQQMEAEGIQLLRGGQAQAAKQRLDQAVALSPRAAEILTWRGIAENQLTEYDAAVADFRRALAIDGALISARYNLALSLIRLHDTDAAIAELRQVVAAQPEAQEAVYNLGVLLESMGSDAEAAQAFAKAHALRPDDAGVTLRLLQARLAAGDATELAPLVTELAEPATAAALQQAAGEALLTAGHAQEAVTLLEAARTHGAAMPESSLVLVRALLGAGRGAEALDLEQELYQGDPGNAARALELARVLLVNDRADQALALLQKLPETPADQTERDVLLGIALAATRDFAGSATHLQRALAANPKQPLAESVLGFCLFAQGAYGPAAAAYGRASDLDPDRPLYARDAAVAYDRSNQADQGLRYAERANARGAGSASDRVVLGKFLLKAGRTKEAIEQLRQAATMNPELDAADYLLARSYAQLGQREEADAWAAKLSALKQQHAAAFLVQKQAGASPAVVGASSLLRGGVLDGDQAGAP